EGHIMAELKDYSGPLRPDLKMTDFSKESLVRLWNLGGKLYTGLDGLWYTLLRERFGEDKARELDAELWRRAAVHEVRRCREAMNITGNDVEAYLKFIQIDPGGGAVFPEFVCELQSEKVGTLTVKRCLGLDYYERHGEVELQKHACEVLDVEGFQRAALLFNPKMKVRPLKLPPRKSKDEIACQWEARLEE
ncbi:MAG: DUF6125 family protein, partial [Chloroflexi bacterium]|nr:DUF6125 family protein [Chloroflexota bacterium]